MNNFTVTRVAIMRQLTINMLIDVLDVSKLIKFGDIYTL